MVESEAKAKAKAKWPTSVIHLLLRPHKTYNTEVLRCGGCHPCSSALWRVVSSVSPNIDVPALNWLRANSKPEACSNQVQAQRENDLAPPLTPLFPLLRLE
jgi:hypothetical protein